MKAMTISEFGNPDVFSLNEMDKPKPGPGEVLVRVIASGTNPVDAKIRASGTWAQLAMPAILGYDASGIIEETGPGVQHFKKGDEVYYTPEIFGNSHGSYAEYNVVPASIIDYKPANLSHNEASSVPLAGGTAWEAVIRRLKIQPGETILIHGGAGGVGSFAVQFAKAAGARVIASAGTDNQKTLEELNVDIALNYREQNVIEETLKATNGEGINAVFDTAGGNINASLEAVKEGGRLATILGVDGDLSSISIKNLTLYGVFLTRENRRLQEMRNLIEQGKVKPLIDQTLPLEQVAEAHKRLDTGHGRGKIVLKVSD
ncbi:MAG TPA: zinc-dependent alcohol dehydrogenase family protein [Balneolales bacterium]|nr:zinc-dependent alcohol dehydrogenase family protein [Balneolales bacterium]